MGTEWYPGKGLAAAPKAPALPSVPQPPQVNQAAYDYWKSVAAQQAPGPVGAGYPTPDLSPEDVNYFDTAKRRADQARGQGFAQADYTRGDQLAQHNAQIAALTQRFDEVRKRLPGTFINRGVGQSGIAAQGYQDYNRDRTQGFGAENLRYNSLLGQNELNVSQMNDVWKSTQADLDAQRAARRNTILAAAANNKTG